MRVIPAADVNRALHSVNLVERLRTAFRSEQMKMTRAGMTAQAPSGTENSVTNTIVWTEGRFIGVRINSTFPENADAGKATELGLYVLLSGRNGDALAMIDGPALFSWARAATMGLAASYFARPDCERLLLIGVSPDIRPILQTFAAIRPIANVLIWDPDRDKALKAASILDKEDRRVAATDDLEAAIRGAHVICHASKTVSAPLKCAWLPSGAHLTLQWPQDTEPPMTLDNWTNVYLSIDQKPEDADTQPGPLSISPADLFQVARGDAPGRANYAQRTAFLQGGTGLEDLVCAITALELT